MPDFLSIAIPPVQLAARCRRLGLPGFAWLDSALPGPGAVSLMATAPVRFVRDWRDLPAGGAAIGWVEYGGELCFAIYPRPLVFHHDVQRWEAPAGSPDWLDAALVLGESANAEWSTPLAFQPAMAPDDFCARVRTAQEHIVAGDIYQVNLSHRLSAPWPAAADPFALYRRLREQSPAPQAAFLDFGDRIVLSASPEEFLRLDGRQIRTRPIKGTRPRDPDPTRDAANSRELLASPKERAELLMITDLLRNDLGAVCEFGSVNATDLFRLEAFANVFHLVSTVEGMLRADVSHADALRSCLPGGSITGAPKRRAREIIARLEPAPRGLYTGSIGCFGPGGVSRFNIAIRTLIVENGEARFHVGSGIVADSDPAAEWAETLHKAAGILRAAGQPL